MNKEFVELYQKHRERLDQFVPIVARVHGKTHPVFYEVQEAYASLRDGMEQEASLTEIFASLRQMTSDYELPKDVCESYEAVYAMLGELDRAYHKQA